MSKTPEYIILPLIDKVRPLAFCKEEQTGWIQNKRQSLDTILKERVSTLYRKAASNKREP